MPTSFGRYFEPFLGSGSLFFHLDPSRAVLSDALEPLVNTFRAVQRAPDQVHSAFSGWPVNRDGYYEIRSLVLDDQIQRAAQFIYLNKTAWNGLYRVNGSGAFNVPFGKPKTSNIVPLVTVRAAARALSMADVVQADFAETLSGAARGDLVFVDPPYVTSHNQNGFLHYNENLFSWEDQKRLATLCGELAGRGVHIIATNANHESIRTLYEKFYTTELSRHSTLASRPEHRRVTTELLFSTMKPKLD